MTEPIDHAERARALMSGGIETLKVTLEEHLNPTGATAEETNIVHKSLANTFAAASVEATLALVAAQDRANELKRIEILAIVASGGSVLRQAAAEHLLDDHDDVFAPSIAASLGLGGESDGE